MTRWILLAALAALGATACENGDWLGPAERGARAAFDGWDMWATESVRPYETPMPLRPAGTVPIDGKAGYEEALAEIGTIPPDELPGRAALAYRRYCHHCHGPNGDGRIIVGESFDIDPRDLRAERVQQMEERQLYDLVRNRIEVMRPIGATTTPLETLLTVRHTKTLAGAPSRPHFSPKSAAPLR